MAEQADTILANSNFTVGVFKRHMPSIPKTPRVVYPGINFDAYAPPDASQSDPDVVEISSYVSSSIYAPFTSHIINAQGSANSTVY